MAKKTEVESGAYVPSVFSLNRTLNVTDGEFKNVFENGSTSPIVVVEHGIKGTQNVAKKDKERDPRNLQISQFAKTDPSAVGFTIEFSVKSLSLLDSIANCSGNSLEKTQEFRAQFMNQVQRSFNSGALSEVSRRIARNIANGRFGWRNRLIVDELTVEATAEGRTVVFNAFSKSLKNFDNPCQNEVWLASILEKGFKGESSRSIRIKAFFKFDAPGAIEVYPSQLYLDKENKKIVSSRCLYVKPFESINEGLAVKPIGTALLRDHKISNALKTIDTWYAKFETIGKPIAAEPQGANTEFCEFFRDGDDSLFEIIKRVGSLAEGSNEEKFFVANLIRGGVFGG